MNKKKAIIAATVFLIAALFIRRESEPAGKPNVLLITIDTLRADHLGCYGYSAKTSPNLDRFAGEALLFQNAYSAVPLTLPSHTTMLTGVYPEHHGIRDNAHFPLKQTPFVQQMLKQNGYATAAFVSGAPLLSGFGLDRGFDVYEDEFEGAERTADVTTARALQWLKSATKPYFLWVHYFDPHSEYEPPGEFRKKFSTPYDGEIAFVDSEISKLLAVSGKDAAVIITADHGESLGEHGETTHAVFVYNSTLHVPLMIRAPGIQPAKRAEAVSLVDVAPTILEYAGVKSGTMDGISLLKQMPARTLLAESLYAQRSYGYAPLFAAIRQGKKFIQAPESEFYDLNADPKEKANVIRKSKVDEWQRAVRAYAKDTGKGKESTLPPEELEKLRSLGYVGATVAQTGADPKSKIQIMERFRLGMVMLKNEEYSQAETRFHEIAKTEQHNGLAFRFLGDALSAQQKYSDAAKAYATSIQLLPDPEVGVQLAKAYNRLQQHSQAESALKDTVKRFPDFSSAVFELASFYSGQKKWNQALALLSHDAPEFHNQRGLVFMAQGDGSSAISEFTRAIGQQGKATYWNNLGIAYQRSNAMKKAEDSYLRALAVNPSYAECEANLSFLLISLKRWPEAEQRLQKVTSQNQKLWRARMALGYSMEMQGKIPEATGVYNKLLADAPPDWPERTQLQNRLKQIQSP